MFKKKIFFSFLFFTLRLCASVPDTLQCKKDSFVSHASVFVIPILSYQQETSWAPGFAYGYYFKSKDLSKISSISGSFIYTFLNQSVLNITPKIFLDNKKWFLYSNINLRNYPDYFFGIGNSPSSIKIPFNTKNISVTLQPQYIISKYFYVGAELAFYSNKVLVDNQYNPELQSIYNKFGSAGWEAFTNSSLGIIASYDSRDNQFYPNKGSFLKFSLSSSKRGWISDYSLQEINLDVRKYLPIFNNHIFAFQIFYNSIFSESNIPFQYLPTIGGRDMLRGFRQGMYRDQFMYLIQAEYRLPIYDRLKAAFFISNGDVFNYKNIQMDKLKIAYGLGLRYRLNDSRVHLRLDIAQDNFGDKLQFYITATEAF